jgi:hypothetical protein
MNEIVINIEELITAYIAACYRKWVRDERYKKWPENCTIYHIYSLTSNNNALYKLYGTLYCMDYRAH